MGGQPVQNGEYVRMCRMVSCASVQNGEYVRVYMHVQKMSYVLCVQDDVLWSVRAERVYV